MRRREFITLIGGAAAGWPLAANAQQMPLIGYLYGGSRAQNVGLPGFVQGLRESGYLDGRNIAVEYRFGDGRNERLPALAAELVGRGVAAIFAGDNASAMAARAATSSIPIVFWVGSDPVKLGLVASFVQPGGNATGVSGLTSQLTAKKLQLLRDMAPKADVVGLLLHPANPGTETDTSEAQQAARALGLQILVVKVSSEGEIDAAFQTLSEHKAGALLLQGDTFLARQIGQVIALAARHRLPAIYFHRAHVAAGGLMSYAASLPEQYRQATSYIGRILKGEKPAELPVQQPARIELVINRKTADALGIAIPAQLEILADEVIE